MKTAHNAEITVFANEGEDLEKIKRKIKNLAAIDLTKEKAILEHTTATGALNNRIDILKIRLEKERQVNQFLQELMSKLTKEQKNMLLEQTESRVDEECNFFIRLDKEKLLDGEYWITDSGNCFHIKILIAAYPAKKEKAEGIIKKILNKSSLN